MKTPFAALLDEGDFDAGATSALRRLRQGLLVPLGLAAALTALWLAAAPLSGAIVAPAQIKV